MTAPNLIPLTVIGGYLGAGKTTLLNRLLHQSDGRRFAVLVNDFGSINIDAALIASHDGETMSLANGCICCSLANGFLTALTQLRDRAEPPEHIIVEASGVADPLKIGQYGHTPGFLLEGIIVLADAETVRKRSRDKYVGRTVVRQLQGADLLILTKPDLVSDDARAAVRDWMRQVAPRAAYLESSHGAVPPELILGTKLHKATDSAGTAPPDLREPGIDHDVAYETWTYEPEHPLTGDVLRAFATALPAGVLRAKGLVYLEEDPEHAAIFQLVGKRWSLKQGPAWDSRPPRTQIVLIGLPGSRDDARSTAT